ncbi:hypothetical protein [Anaeromyxobacter oryzae]|uniref:Transmembrane protein n=1 Tax=Anaeromyxobacter oryzae TaxID=2918170 RepID=A0ABM7WS90_9BACT|nr:hypothetical protein [Anaeromyxobacter oryzae]BDG02335.1 hypothetical protein AMOR_13310 [Anaeromyxobacter oryzae]
MTARTSTAIPALVAALLGAGVAPAPAQAGTPAAAGAARARPAATAKRETSASWHARRGLHFQRTWGVDIVGVRPVSSGYMLRFDYRVVDPEKAAALTDRKARPYLIDEATRTALAVPAMENVGELRQMAPPQQDRTYFMIFGNPGRLVKRGSRVTIVVGNLRAEGVVVD